MVIRIEGRRRIGFRGRFAALWKRVLDALVMEGPHEWDIHPDVRRRLQQKKAS